MGHLADRALTWSPLNDPPEIVDASEGTVDWGGRRRVIIYGAGHGSECAPLDDVDWVVWAINLIPPLDTVGRVRADCWFDLHQREAQTADDLRWIAACPLPIFVPPDLLSQSTRAVRFPIEQIEARFGATYWSCTFAYQIALAMLDGFTDIGLFGIELAYGTERERTVEWACVSWWMGFAQARGIRFHLPVGGRMGTHAHRYGLEYHAEKREVETYIDRMREGDKIDRVSRLSVGG